MRRRRGAAVLAAALFVGACTASPTEEPAAVAVPDEAGDQPRVVQPGAPGEPNRELSPEEAAAAERELEEALRHTPADVAFMQGMIPHHVQAIRMTRLVPERTGRDDVPLFAERIDLSQADEIDVMRRWLEDRGEDVPSLLADHADHGGHGGDGDGELMPGMLTEEQFAALEAASGETFDVLFLEAMILHHAGALQMVEDLYEGGGGIEPEIARFAQHVASDQEIEIARAQQLLADILGTR